MNRIKVEPTAAVSLRTLRVGMACARALLDEVEVLLSAGARDAPVREVVLQTAEELAAIAAALRSWGTRGPAMDRSHETPSAPQIQ